MSHFVPFTCKMHESLTFSAGLRVLTGDVGPHASCVLARLIIIFMLLEPTEPIPQSYPLWTASETVAPFTDLGLTWIRVIRRDLINKDMNDVTSVHYSIERVDGSRQCSGLSLPCCRCFAWTSPAASQPAGTTGSRCLSDPWRSRRWFPDLTRGHIKRRINSTIKCSFLKICIRKYNINSSLFPLWCWSRCRLTDLAWLVPQHSGLSAGAKCSTITA